jgi:hypothetical protein
MSQVIQKYPVAPKADRDDEKAERQALRDLKAGLIEIREGTQALIDGLEGAAIGAVRTTCKEILRRQKELTKAVISLARIAGGPPR